MNYSAPNPSEQPRKKSRGRGFVITAVILLVLAAAGVVIYKYVLESAPSTDITVASVAVSDQSIELCGSFNGFAGLKDYGCTVDEDIAIIELYPTLPIAGAHRDFSLEIPGDFSGVSEINLSDGRNSLVVWTCDQPAQQASEGDE
ncbi:MAG: hypothetical protein E7554_07545 [Ruminococcaceae bacterium]|nr:hypothetical protein [Oscillospiraceae bacterium]